MKKAYAYSLDSEALGASEPALEDWLFARLTGYMLAGCIADGHPWFQVVTWALLAPAFAMAAWLVVRRMRGASPNAAS